MTEQQFKYEIRECCKRILNDVVPPGIEECYLENMNYSYHDENVAWVEYYGTKLKHYDNHAVDILGKVMHAICTKHNIIYLQRMQKSQ